MTKKLRSLLFVVLLLSGTALAAGHKVPDLNLKDLDGHKQSLKALRGNIVVLSFWATWCGPCQEELPRLSHLSEGYAGKPVKFIAVSIDEKKSRTEIAAFLMAHNVHLETWTGATVDTMGDFGLGDIVPGTIILDDQGEAVTRISGEAHEDDVTSRVDWLLHGRTGAAPEPMVIRH
jgi:thiol-disulfide isomerase/thioredoxin